MYPRVLLPLRWTSRLSSCVQYLRCLAPILRNMSAALMQTRLWTQPQLVLPAIPEPCFHHSLLFRAGRVMTNHLMVWEYLEKTHLLSRLFRNKCYPLIEHGNGRFKICSNRSEICKPKWRNFVLQTTKGTVKSVGGLSPCSGLKTMNPTKTSAFSADLGAILSRNLLRIYSSDHLPYSSRCFRLTIAETTPSGIFCYD